MTQVQSIQGNIHYVRTQLNKARKVICKDELQKLHIQSAIEFYFTELNDLKFCLNCAIKLI